jgi:prolyl-tRNA synthetase
MTHEESMTAIIRDEINSYKQLPVLLYQIKLKFRDEPRPRAGLIRVREFTMKDAYSIHTNQEDLDDCYNKVYQAYLNVFRRCALDVVVVQSDSGMMGGKMAHEFMLVTPSGEDNLVLCSDCDYAANAEVAVMRKSAVNNGDPMPIEKVATPGKKTIEDVARFLGVDRNQTLKAVFYSNGEKLFFIGIRGDLEVNETKLRNALREPDLYIANEEEVAKHNLVAGYASPIGIEGTMLVVDDTVIETSNLVAGANEEGYHYRNVNYGRDFSADLVADISLASDGDLCAECGSPLNQVKGIEVGNIFKLGTKYSEAMGADFLDQDGDRNPVLMCSYGIGVGRLLASVIERWHDENGIIFPISIAPYQFHLISIGGDPNVRARCDEIYKEMAEKGYEVLYDDRDERPGVKFKDADLIGIPIRLGMSRRTLSDGVIETKLRAKGDIEMVSLSEFDPDSLLIAAQNATD